MLKPDQLIKRRGKLGLVKTNLTWDDAKSAAAQLLGKQIQVENVTGTINCLILEPMHAFTNEYYLCIHSLRDCDEMLFHHQGGVDVGNVDEKALKLKIPVGSAASAQDISSSLLSQVSTEDATKLADFFVELYKLYVALAFTYLEINPIVVNEDGCVTPLDLAAKVDLTAQYDVGSLWGEIEMPPPFGRESTKEEAHIAAMTRRRAHLSSLQ